MKAALLGLIWSGGAMGVMAVCSRLYARKEQKRKLLAFYGLVLVLGVLIRIPLINRGGLLYGFSLAMMLGLVLGTWKLSGERLAKILIIFSFVFIGAVFCEVIAGSIFFQGPAVSVNRIFSSSRIVPAALLGNVLWVVYISAAVSLWIHLEKKCVLSRGRSLCFLIIFQAAALMIMILALYLGVVNMGLDFCGAVILQVIGTFGFMKLQMQYEEVREMESQVKQLEMESQREYERYVELEEEYRSLHQLRHDFNNQLTTAYYLVQSGKREGACQLLREMEDMLGGGGEDETMPED
ncbi:MAG TPA: hypothetical protein IAA51_07465 [Candidatus Cottocaccamicrobium excrementipullorum]|nr:hypothetical protein [Candidatus Cottocaccamicrobium excrementipullorum]